MGENTGLRESFSSSTLSGNLLPLGLFLICILTVVTTSGPALYFSQAEVNILYTAPISRASLVLYKMMSYANSAFLSALLITPFLPRLAGSHVATLLALVLTLLFVQLFSTTIRMFFQILASKWHRRPSLKLVTVLSVSSIILIGMLLANSQTNPIELLLRAIDSDFASKLLYPLRVITNLHFSTTIFPEFITLATLTVLFITGLIPLILKMDVTLIEQSLMQSMHSQKKWQKIKKSGMLWQTEMIETASLPVPVHIVRAYPMIWIQWLKLVRTYASTILFLAGAMLVLGPVLALSGSYIPASTRFAVLFFFCVFFLPRIMVFDFRGTLEYMELLKKMPVKEWRICLSQIMLPVAVSSLLQILLILAAAPFVKNVDFKHIIFIMMLIVPFNFILYLVENIIFLLFPARLVPVGRVDFDFLGRTLAEFLVKTLILALIAIVTLAALVGCYRYITHSWVLLAGIGWLIPVLAGLSLHQLLVRVFIQFDSSKYSLT